MLAKRLATLCIIEEHHRHSERHCIGIWHEGISFYYLFKSSSGISPTTSDNHPCRCSNQYSSQIDYPSGIARDRACDRDAEAWDGDLSS